MPHTSPIRKYLECIFHRVEGSTKKTNWGGQFHSKLKKHFAVTNSNLSLQRPDIYLLLVLVISRGTGARWSPIILGTLQISDQTVPDPKILLLEPIPELTGINVKAPLTLMGFKLGPWHKTMVHILIETNKLPRKEDGQDNSGMIIFVIN